MPGSSFMFHSPCLQNSLSCARGRDRSLSPVPPTPKQCRDFLSVMLLSQELGLWKTQLYNFKTLLHVVYNSETIPINMQRKDIFKLHSSGRLQRQHLSPCFYNSTQTLPHACRQISPSGGKPGKLPWRTPSLAQLFLVNHHTCCLNAEIRIVNLLFSVKLSSKNVPRMFSKLI